MKKIIGGRKYDTDTAALIGEWSDGYPRDFRYECETLYRKRTGEYFLHGEGGAMSKYAVSHGDNSWGGGEEIIPLSYDRAREWAEKHLDADDYEAAFGEVSEGDEDVMLSVRVPASVKATVGRLAAQSGRTMADIVADAIVAYASR